MPSLSNGMDFALSGKRNFMRFGGDTVNQNRLLGICLIFLIILFIFIQPAYVGPGGITVKALISNFWGKAALVLMALTCLPLAIYVYIREQLLDEQSFKHLRRTVR